jgi:CubicO group peptidase (beta-lactamase class C family)
MTFTRALAVLEQAAAARTFPAAVIEVGTATQPLWQHALGRLIYDPAAAAATLDTVFDLASLTKVLATTPLVMRLVERGGLGLDDRVASHLPAWQGADRQPVTVRDLLAHCSGLPAYRPLYLDHSGVAAFEAAIGALPLEYPWRTGSLYSDLDFILLGAILGRVAPLAQQFDAMRVQMRIAGDLQFNPPALWTRRAAPTRHSDHRQRLLIGEVDDDNAWALGGAAGHAGLFGTAAAVGECARHVLQVLDGRTGAFSRELLRMFTRAAGVPNSSRALGWDTMRPTSSCGTRMSPSAFGHTGFTGTSLWIDPERDLYVVLLTNRVHPVAGDAAAIKQVRRDVHDAVFTEL